MYRNLLIPLTANTIAVPAVFAQGTICTPQANVAIYSNYDGGALSINVDQNIPDLHIGVVSYEFSRITLLGPFAGNVTAIWYVGYDADNNHCSLPLPHTTSISGAPVGTDSIILYPAATFANTNGYGSIICNYSCDVNSSQGGCNTADQIAHWFLTQWGGTLLFHFTQYGCWGNGYSISGGGNCCENPLATGTDGAAHGDRPFAVLQEDVLVVGDPAELVITDASGRCVLHERTTSPGARIDVSNLRAGAYAIRDLSSRRSMPVVILR